LLINVFLILERSDLSYYLDYVVIVHRMHGEQKTPLSEYSSHLS